MRLLVLIALTKLASWDQSTKFPVDHHFLHLLCAKVGSKGKIMRQSGFDNAVYLLSLSGTCLKAPEKTRAFKFFWTKSVQINLLANPEYSQPNKNTFILALAIQFGEVAADTVLFRFGEGNIQFSESISDKFNFRNSRSRSITDFEDKYLKKILNLKYVKMQQLIPDNMQFTELF